MSLSLPEPPSRNRSASTGDSGLPKHEHKRPRLSESRDNQIESLTVSTVNGKKSSTMQPTASPSTSDHTVSATTTPPHSPLPSSAQPDATSPTSKVTINTRPISSQASATNAQFDVSDKAMESDEASTIHNYPSQASVIQKHFDRQDAISISSDEPGSPVIQIAAPEDLDQDPAETQWQPISDHTSSHRQPIHANHVRRTFPFKDQFNKHPPYNIISQISKTFAEGNVDEQDVFQKVKQWLVDFADRAENLDWDFFDDDRDFWLKLPSVVGGLLRRKNELSNRIQIEDITGFFVAFARITTIIADADLNKLRSYTSLTDPRHIVNPYCLTYMYHMHWIVTADNISLYEKLHESLNYSPTIITDLIMDQLLDSLAVKHFQLLNSLFQSMADLFLKRPALVEQAMNMILHAGQFLIPLSKRAAAASGDSAGSADQSLALMSVSVDIMQSIDAVLDRAIAKQQPWLNIEACERIFKAVPSFIGSLAISFPQVATSLVSTANLRPSDFGDEEVLNLAHVAWKFSALQKFIKKGRMEVRVICVQIMALDLVEIYNEHLRSANRDTEHVSVQFMVQLLRQNDMIRYIIGVDSHPQIIDRCANIIGFLCVSHNYCNDDTDAIWQTVLESQDPRSVVALLGIFGHNLDNLDIGVLCYIGQKLLDSPYDRFDTPMLEFAVRLITTLANKVAKGMVSADEAVTADECTIRLCLKLLREANVIDQICSDLSLRTRNRIVPILTQKVKLMGCKLSFGTEDDDSMRPILADLCKDIESHTKFASGSILALGTMLDAADSEECSRVVEQHDLAALLVQNIVQTCSTMPTSTLQDSTLTDLENRFKLMITLAFRSNHTITESLLTNLWVNLLAAAKLHQRLRYMAWFQLARIFDHCRLRNNLLDNIVQNYLPTLSVTLYDEAVLYFVLQSVKYEMRHSPIELVESEDVVDLPGIERIWSFMLRAPPNTVELEALQFIIDQYLDGDTILQRDHETIERTHLALIDRTVQQVIAAADHLKVASDVVMNDKHSMNQSPEGLSKVDYAMRFHRCLLFLRKFLDTMKTKPRYTPAVNDSFKKTLSTFDKKGNLFEVTLQIMGHKTLASTQIKWFVGFENSGVELWQFLSDITGWDLLTIISGGKKHDLKDDQRTLRDIGIRTGSIMITKAQGSAESVPARVVRAASPVDNKVMHHFDELYNLLDLDNQYAREVFDFLRMFSSQAEVVQKLKSMRTPAEQLLPVEKPFKLMYYARALQSCIEAESFDAEPDTAFLVYGIQTILSVLPNLDRVEAEIDLCVYIAQSLVETLILAFRARVPAEISVTYISDGKQFCQTIFGLWSRALDITASEVVPSAGSVARAPFEVLVEALLHDDRLWSAIPSSTLVQYLQRALLTHPARDVRQATLEVIHGLTGVIGPKAVIKNNEMRTPRNRFSATVVETCLGHLWNILLVMVSEADKNATTCEEFFEAITSVLRKHQSRLSQSDLQSCVEIWRTYLLAHSHSHLVGLAPYDFFISSLGRLLILAVRAIYSEGSVNDSKSLIRDIFSRFLFPPMIDVSSDVSETSISQQQSDPVLDMNTRWVLYELIILLCHEEGNMDVVCDELNSDLVPRDYYLQPMISNERQTLRSEAGYSGLRNLSNTCYLNSLISQLFMNVEFRELMMNVNIIDRSKQKLVAELGKVFAYMQKSYEEAVTPESAIDAITLWDGEQIDVTVQMDVDEFFNLLFDRLESQIVDPKVCNAFKSIYGGQLVQQIKSKECEHVSERLEPFTAVQVEIKGKAGLEESLRAYVEGEVLQGENKYSCTGCGKHVDAVKRACLKTVPDHLIFNLKRFDFDIMTGMRCKVNDEFGFPDTIDMAPYTLEALSNPGQPQEKDLFELVGVIVHSGTAESGHYYSYIRQRPSNTPREKSWMHFNDHEVNQFDPANIKDCCFGGIDYSTLQCARFFNGYMLFYQRSSSLKAFESKYLDSSIGSPVRLPLSPDLDSYIAQTNELFLRTYVAQDPIHAKFIKALLQQKRNDINLDCAKGHGETTSKLITVALNYVHRVSARWKDMPEVEETMTLLQSCARDCVECARKIIDWLVEDENLVNNLVRTFYATVRKCFTVLIATCWTKLTAAVSQSQPLQEHHQSTITSEEYNESLDKFLRIMSACWEVMQRFPRAWDHYLGVLSFIINTGHIEAKAVIELGFFELALELVHCHVTYLPISKRLRTKYQPYLVLRDRNRPYVHGLLIQVFAEMLQYIDLAAPIPEHVDRMVFEHRVGLNHDEASLLGINQPYQFLWFKKILYGRANPLATNTIIQHLCRFRQFDQIIGEVLKQGIGDKDLQSAITCLQPSIVFLSLCSTKQVVIDIVGDALELIDSTNGQYGKDYLSYVQELSLLSNEEIPISRGSLKHLIKQRISHWAPVLLTASSEMHADVRGDTLEFVNEILFQDMEELRHTNPRIYLHNVNICRTLAEACSTHVSNVFLVPRTSAIEAGQAHQIIQVVDRCLRFFGETANDEDLATQITAVMEEFRQRSEGLIESINDADWNASSDVEAMSEVDNLSDTSN